MRPRVSNPFAIRTSYELPRPHLATDLVRDVTAQAQANGGLLSNESVYITYEPWLTTQRVAARPKSPSR